MLAKTFRHADGVVPNSAALACTLFGFAGGIALLGATAGLANTIGFLLVVATLTWSAYFIREFATRRSSRPSRPTSDGAR